MTTWHGVSSPIAGKVHSRLVDTSGHVLKTSAIEFQREKTFPDSTLLKLLSLFGTVFERAIELHALGKFTKVTAFDPRKTGFWEEIYAARSLVQIQESSGQGYTIFPGVNYCPCSAFKFHIFEDQSNVTCKHLLAVWLANLTAGKIIEKKITPRNFKNLLLHQVSSSHHGFADFTNLQICCEVGKS